MTGLNQHPAQGKKTLPWLPGESFLEDLTSLATALDARFGRDSIAMFSHDRRDTVNDVSRHIVQCPRRQIARPQKNLQVGDRKLIVNEVGAGAAFQQRLKILQVGLYFAINERFTCGFLLRFVLHEKGWHDFNDDVLNCIHDFIAAQRLQRIFRVQTGEAADKSID